MTLQHGAIAQLGERYAGSVEVRGSSPLGSIPLNPYSINKGFFVFCGSLCVLLHF